jgi:streptogramin lyase
LTSPISSGGHRDGEISIAQFRNPSQIFCDNDGNMYVADSDNHCIRRITPELMVETVLGMPGTAGWKDGGRQEALFNHPRGIGIAQDGSVYVADNGNNRLRKLSIN